MKKLSGQEDNQFLVSKLPMWVKNRLIGIDFEKNGHRPHYTVEMKPFDYDDMKENVIFDAYCMEDLKHQFRLYKETCSRTGIHYMMFR